MQNFKQKIRKAFVVNKRDDTFLQSFCSPLTAVSKVHIPLFSCFDKVVYTFLCLYTFLY